jgi:IS30 family transposase
VLSLAEREEISRGVVAGRSMRSMASTLGRAPSTVSREIGRNGGGPGYRASDADQGAWNRAQRPKSCKLACNRELARIVAQKLKRLWSPEQIAGWLKSTYPGDENYQVSHETIYRTLYIQTRGALKKELLQHLRRTRAMRRSRHHTQKTADHGRICHTIPISERPPSAEDRAVPGHWEGDLIFGTHNSQIVTLVERQTRYVMMAKVNSKDTETVINALVKHAHQLPKQLYASLTWDRGSEMADHPRFTLATDIKVYFCDPQNPWQRGSNENTNGLLRQYFPKGTDLSVHSQAKLNAVARQLNERPRKTLNFETPAQRFSQCVASIG